MKTSWALIIVLALFTGCAATEKICGTVSGWGAAATTCWFPRHDTNAPPAP